MPNTYDINMWLVEGSKQWELNVRITDRKHDISLKSYLPKSYMDSLSTLEEAKAGFIVFLENFTKLLKKKYSR